MKSVRKPLGVRWTIGSVSQQGFDALRLSVWGVRRVFGDEADYVICVNSIPVDDAQQKTGGIPNDIAWIGVTAADAPALVLDHVDDAMAEGVAWKFAPLRLFPDRHELALDNDCILWALPESLRDWLAAEDLCIIAEDVNACFGQYAEICGSEPRNSGIRGLPPGFDLAAALEATFDKLPIKLRSELDEQGLQVAAVSLEAEPLTVATDDVSICSPFHMPYLGRCGAHFVGLNAGNLPWSYDGRGASEWTRENWARFKPQVSRLVNPKCEPEPSLEWQRHLDGTAALSLESKEVL
jgi:hypothetical protein